MNLNTRLQVLREAQSDLSKAVWRLAATCQPFGSGQTASDMIENICVYARVVKQLHDDLSDAHRKYYRRLSPAHRSDIQKQLAFAGEMLHAINFDQWNERAA